ncbi:MAG: hypothetical protein C6I00_01350 [Nitratiruptor sp.]|nr:hypothetical protein [Nitratiruptor sp.]NPA83243.1 hypothetical protein [Campylobacterota bacterium]
MVPLLLSLAVLLFGGEHKALVEPYHLYTYKAAVSGPILLARDGLEGRKIKDEVVVRIDDGLDRIQLRELQRRRALVKQRLRVEEEVLSDLRALVELKEQAYRRIRDLASKAASEKERRLGEYLGAKERLGIQRAKIISLREQLATLATNIAQVEDRIAKKRLVLSGYLVKVLVRQGEYATPGTPLAQIADTSKGRVVVYLSPQEMEDIEEKGIYINGRAIGLGFAKLLRVSDERHLGQYRGEILVDAPELFGKVVKVEIR